MNTDQMEPLRVAFAPVYPNPYQRLLAGALEAEGVLVEMQTELPGIDWLHEVKPTISWLHLHWLSGLYMARYRTPAALLRFWRWLDTAQRLGFQLAWTAHNVLPHRTGLDPLHRLVRQRVLREADLVIAHCEQARQILRATFGVDRSIHVVPIGSYASVLPLTIDRQEARRRLGIDNGRFVYLSLGNIAPYKGLARYARLFLKMATAADLALIAGRNRDPRLVRQLAEMARHDDRLRLDIGFIPDDELQNYLRAADVVVAPFERILTSASVMMAMDAGRPVIAPRLGCLPELVTPACGLLYDQSDAGLLNALHEIRRLDLNAMGQAATIRASSFGWAKIARVTASLYRDPARPEAPVGSAYE